MLKYNMALSMDAKSIIVSIDSRKNIKQHKTLVEKISEYKFNLLEGSRSIQGQLRFSADKYDAGKVRFFFEELESLGVLSAKGAKADLKILEPPSQSHSPGRGMGRR